MIRAARFALMGHPVRQSPMPAMFRAAFLSLGLPHFFDTLDCPDGSDVRGALGTLRRGVVAGLSVGAPHRQAVLAMVDHVDPLAQEAGEANTVLRDDAGKLTAMHTDVPALVEEIHALSAAPTTALVLGAGPAARCAVLACRKAGVRVVGVTTRSWSSSELLFDSAVA